MPIGFNAIEFHGLGMFGQHWPWISRKQQLEEF